MPLPNYTTNSVTPSEGEIFNRFSPELQARNLANRERRQRDHEDFVSKLKEYSKSDKPSTSLPNSVPLVEDGGEDGTQLTLRK